MSDILKLEHGFIHDYRSDSAVFNILVVDNQIETKDVTSEVVNSWNIHWENASAKVDQFLKDNELLQKFVNKMF
jgi:hypothetical protein